MSNRTTPVNATPSVWGQPFVGEKTKNVTVQGPYNAQQSGASVATSDVVIVYADYGVWDSTVNVNLDSNSTNLKDPA